MTLTLTLTQTFDITNLLWCTSTAIDTCTAKIWVFIGWYPSCQPTNSLKHQKLKPNQEKSPTGVIIFLSTNRVLRRGLLLRLCHLSNHHYHTDHVLASKNDFKSLLAANKSSMSFSAHRWYLLVVLGTAIIIDNLSLLVHAFGS